MTTPAPSTDFSTIELATLKAILATLQQILAELQKGHRP